MKTADLKLANADHFSANVIAWAAQRITIQPVVRPGARLDVPVNHLAELWCGTADQLKKAAARKEQPGLEEIAFAAKDDQVLAVHGVVVGIDGDSLTFHFNSQDRKIALSRLVGVIFARQDLPADDSLTQVVQLSSDQVISGTISSMDTDALELHTRWGQSMRIPLDQVLKMTCRNGKLVYLSDLKPASVEQVPYFDRLLSFRVDQSLDGKALVLSDGTYRHGIAVHSRCVLGDGKLLFEQPDARGDQPPFEVKMKIAGVQRLTLEVDFGKGQDVGDRVVWANARLLRAQPK